MPHEERGSDGKSAISRSRMNVNLLEWRGIKDFSIRHAIESHTASQANGFQSCPVRKSLQHAEIDFLQPYLQRSRQVAMTLFQGLVRRARRTQPPSHPFCK